MTPIEKALIMAFGAALAIAGVILFAKMKGNAEGTNKIKFARLELEFGAPSLFIFLTGCGLFVFPFFVDDSVVLNGDTTVASTPDGSALSNVAPAAMTAAESSDRQAELERKLAELQSRLEHAQQSASNPVQNTALRSNTVATPNIAGQWQSSTGSVYLVAQDESDVTIQEFTQGVVSAVGEGTFDGRELDASFQTLVGEVDVVLNLSSDRTRFSGQLTHTLTGGTTAFEMHR